jgi:hypothetical protein
MRILFHPYFYRCSAFLLFLFATPALADTPIITDTAGVHSQICNVFTWMFWVLIAVSVIMVMWAAYLFVTARDDAEQVTEAKKTIFYAAFGILAGLIAKGFPVLVGSIFGQSISGC